MIVYVIAFLVSIFATMVGAICGMGGGIIIKPVIDATGMVQVAATSFLSACTVLAMTAYSFGKAKLSGNSRVDTKTSFPLAVGGVIGGIAGKRLFQLVLTHSADPDTVGLIQAVALVLFTVVTLILTIRKSHIRTLRIEKVPLIIVIGLVLGLISAFLGIGGGPINVVALLLLFSMDMKTAALNSLYIILFAQAAAIIMSIVTRTVPPFMVAMLILMIAGGILGGILGHRINRFIKEETVNKLFIVLMIFIIAVNMYDVIQFM